MQPPRRFDDVRPWLQEEVIRVAKDELLSRSVCVAKVDPLEGSVGGDGDVGGRVDDAVGCVDPPDPGLRLG